jgi:3-hydroxy acid dehydrogenase/malonic semialdehyde reductase
VAGFGDEVVLVTGATSGIGRAVAEDFAAAGARVIGTGRRVDRLEALRGALGARFLPLPLDVRDVGRVETAIRQLPDPFAAVTVLVNSAGLARGLARAQTANWADAAEMIDTNVRGTLAVTHAVLPGMVQRERGHIVNLGSVAADTPYPGGNVYGGTKAFVRQWTLNLKADLLGTPIRVTCIEPGMVRTEYLEVRFRGDKARAEAMYREVDHLTAADIASLVRMVTSLPARVNVTLLQVMPTEQAHAGYAFAAPVRLAPSDEDV